MSVKHPSEKLYRFDTELWGERPPDFESELVVRAERSREAERGAMADPTAAERHNALVYARRHLKTHMDWQRFLKAGGELPCEEVGDLEHQEKAIGELNVICKVLRAALSNAAEAEDV